MNVNFTKEHFNSMMSAIAKAVIDRVLFKGPVGQSYNICEVFDLSINSLRSLSRFIAKKETELSITDEWIENPNTEEVELLTWEKGLISLIIGYKLWKTEVAENNKERERINKQIEELEASQKTPEDLIKELKEKLVSLECDKLV